jgi:hypothetical protein
MSESDLQSLLETLRMQFAERGFAVIDVIDVIDRSPAQGPFGTVAKLRSGASVASLIGRGSRVNQSFPRGQTPSNAREREHNTEDQMMTATATARVCRSTVR